MPIGLESVCLPRGNNTPVGENNCNENPKLLKCHAGIVS
jgi:hypothetical protein